MAQNGNFQEFFPHRVTVSAPRPPSLGLPSATSAPGAVEELTPISQLVFFHKAIRAELEEFHKSAVALRSGVGPEALAFLKRYRFIRAVYKYHSWAEDEVVFPALDARVKNVANAYALEHQIESNLFDELSEMMSSIGQKEHLDEGFRSRLACCAEAISTILAQHLAKEEQHVFPLLRKHFSSEEQGRLMWDFLASLPVKLMLECLPWVASHLSEAEQREMAVLLRTIIPRESLVQQVFSGWVKHIPRLEHHWEGLGAATEEEDEDGPPLYCAAAGPRAAGAALPRAKWETEKGQGMGRSTDLAQCPIDEFVRWHDALRVELKGFEEELGRLERECTVDHSGLSGFEERLRFLASICQYHSIAEDEVVFPALVQTGTATEGLTKAHAEDQERFTALGELLVRLGELKREAALGSASSPSSGLASAPALGSASAPAPGLGSPLSGRQEEGDQVGGELGQREEVPGEAARVALQELCQLAATLVVSILEHLVVEEQEVLPLLRVHCSAEEQRSLVLRSLLVMPLNLLEAVLPWLHRHLTQDEAAQIIQNMEMAGQEVDEALVKLLVRWSSQGAPAVYPQSPSPASGLSRGQPPAGEAKALGAPGPLQAPLGSLGRSDSDGWCSSGAGAGAGEDHLPQRKRAKRVKGLTITFNKEEPDMGGGSSDQQGRAAYLLSGSSGSFLAKGPDSRSVEEQAGLKQGGGDATSCEPATEAEQVVSARCISSGSPSAAVEGSTVSPLSGLTRAAGSDSATRVPGGPGFSGCGPGTAGASGASGAPGRGAAPAPSLFPGGAFRAHESPIDAIFTFHHALRKELDYICAQSRRLAEEEDGGEGAGRGSEAALRDFSGRFHFVWGLYRAHSSAEDSIVFPALEEKEALHNVSHSYSIDHKQEEELFRDIAAVLAELAEVKAALASCPEALPESHCLNAALGSSCADAAPAGHACEGATAAPPAQAALASCSKGLPEIGNVAEELPLSSDRHRLFRETLASETLASTSNRAHLRGCPSEIESEHGVQESPSHASEALASSATRAHESLQLSIFTNGGTPGREGPAMQQHAKLSEEMQSSRSQRRKGEEREGGGDGEQQVQTGILRIQVEAEKGEEQEGELGHGGGRAQELERRSKQLAGKLTRMCLSVRVALDQHVSREEVELWPLFGVHFSVEEQDRIVGRIIGTTGAEVLQAMLTWITAALDEREQRAMMGALAQVSKNTMFEEWLSNWWGQHQGWEARAGGWTPGDAPGDDDSWHRGSPRPTGLQADSGSARGHSGAGRVEGKEKDSGGADDPLRMVAEYFHDGLPEADPGEVQHGEAEHRDGHPGEVEPEEVGKGAEHPESAGQRDLGLEHAAGEASGGPTVGMRGGEVEAIGPPAETGGEGQRQQGQGQGEFRSGWHNIFRMNQKQLEAAIRKVSRDTSLDPRRKAYLMQNLMTSRWIVAQQQGPGRVPVDEGGSGVRDRCPSYADDARGILGCEHYQRGCKVKAECCGRLFVCHFCHDRDSDHAMERRECREMMCMRCMEVQPIGQHCASPQCRGARMARYYCSICKMLDDSRDIYHCPFCNLCRVGKGLGIDYFHCMKCNACMSVSLAQHKCREKGLEANCPICHDFLFTSHTPVRALPCGHFMHSSCFQSYTFEHYTCPLCCKSVGDMSVYFGMLDALLASEQLPEEYRGTTQAILCNDCGKRGDAAFHWLYHKCSACGSYNTKAL